MTKNADLKYQRQLPDSQLSDYIKCFWEVKNTSSSKMPVDILPDGYFDILHVSAGDEPYKASLIGLSTRATTFTIPAYSHTLAVSFKLPAAECILKARINSLLDDWKYLPENYWNLTSANLYDFDSFINSATAIIARCLDKKTDSRKQALFHKIYETNGDITVEQLSYLTAWSSRQINRYFQGNFGLSLKKYCNILRFRASFDHLYNGQLFPATGYFDQPHFIRDVHKFSGTSPKHLATNKEDRFIQLSTLSDQ